MAVFKASWEWHEWRQSFGRPDKLRGTANDGNGIRRDFDGNMREPIPLPGTEKAFQDFETYRMEYRPALTDEQWLWLAQIDAVRCSLHHGPSARTPYEYEQDRRWVESREDHIGSFEWVCSLFPGYNAEALREALLAIVPSGGRRYAVRPSGSQMGPRPCVNHKKPKGRGRMAA